MDMVDDQIIKRGVRDKRVIEAFRRVPRELFIRRDLKYRAYDDNPLPIGYGQTISQPYIVAYMSEVLEIKEDDKVLEIGTGSGYQAAILSLLAREVYSIERLEDLSKEASIHLEEGGFKNINLKVGDGYNGWKSKSPFNKIIITAAASKIPEPLIKQLSKNGGKLVIPLGEEYGYQELVLITKKGRDLEIKRLLPVRFVPFISNYFTL